MKGCRGNFVKIISSISAILLVISLLMMSKVFFCPAKGVHHGPPALEMEEPKGEELPSVAQLKATAAGGEDVFNRILKEKSYSQMEHFHNVDSSLDIKKRVPTLCLICHGNYPHSKKKEVRSLYNMHTFFCACETCHIRGENLKYAWFDNHTGEEISSIKDRVPDGIYAGNYGAKIIPCYPDKIGKYRRLDQPITEEFAHKYLKLWSQYTYDQQSKAKLETHKRLSQQPVSCADCHRKEKPVLDFAALGYPKHLCDEFSGTEVAGMVEKYKSLYLPTMFRPESIIEGKEQLKDGKIPLPITVQEGSAVE